MRSITGKLTKELFSVTNSKSIAKDIPLRINSFAELIEQVAKLSYLNKDHLLFFRGQSNDYKDKAQNSTLYPSIYRGDYLRQRELDYRFNILNNSSKILIQLFRKSKIEGRVELARKKLIQWSILQHYEVTETPLLDFTHSLRVACSFALQNNERNTGYVYIIGLPYMTNRISVNSEHDIVNIRLLGICPPSALRPYYQEGYLVGTEDITNEYENKNELDFKNRLIAKFEIPKSKEFWGRNFNQIPHNALYPKNDIIRAICSEIREEAEMSLTPGTFGEFLHKWEIIEKTIIKVAQRYSRVIYSYGKAINLIASKEKDKIGFLAEIDYLRRFRNNLVHNPSSLNQKDVIHNLKILDNFVQIIADW